MQLPALEQKTHFISAGFDQSELPITGANVWQMSFRGGFKVEALPDSDYLSLLRYLSFFSFR